jgi:uncharacterized metal-binding protein
MSPESPRHGVSAYPFLCRRLLLPSLSSFLSLLNVVTVVTVVTTLISLKLSVTASNTQVVTRGDNLKSWMVTGIVPGMGDSRRIE